MRVRWDTLRAMLDCTYKAWLLSKESSAIPKYPLLPSEKISLNDKTTLTAYTLLQQDQTQSPSVLVEVLLGHSTQPTSVRIKPTKKAEKLAAETRTLVNQSDPPPFYKNKHCPECQFKDACYQKLKERDCISLLGSISPTIVAKYHKRGIFSIMQLSHQFRPRRRSRRKPKIAGNYMWELKALALREQKTFVMYTPEPYEISNAIYIDFEGLPEQNFIYLIGVIVIQENKTNEVLSFWADTIDQEKDIFQKLFAALERYPGIPIYHYGSYESKALKHVVKKYGGSFKPAFAKLEKQLINLLSYLRTYFYPPIYGNGLKELAGFLGFAWSEPNASGLQSIQWRNQWELTHEQNWKEKLLHYNQEDCQALERVNEWFVQLALNGSQEGVQPVAEMKRQSPYKFQANRHFGEDYDYISKAAYFDYQRSKIYWRNKKAPPPAINSREHQLKKHPGKGIAAWAPKKAQELVLMPVLKKCPFCGHPKLYQLKKSLTIRKQTDLKFTSTGIKQHTTEYRSHQGKCAKCLKKFNNNNLRYLLYGENLFAWIIHIYVNYHLSNHLISRLVLEQFGIWINPMYLQQRKYKWWVNWLPEVDYIRQIILNSPVIHIDETNVKLSKDKGYVWVFATAHSVLYHFTYNREAEFLKEWLKDYKGVIVTDFFPGYDSLPVKRQKCLIHLIRDLNDDLYKNPFDEEFKALVTAFSKLLRGIIETIDKHGLQKKYLEKHLKNTEAFNEQFLVSEHKGELTIKYTKRLKKHWDEMWIFLTHDDVPWNNNNAETAIKAFAQHRRGVNGQVAEKGLREYLEMLSLSQTCRYRNISYLDLLRHKAGIWENASEESLPGFLPFNQAKLFIHRLGFERTQQWLDWKKAGKRPSFIPSNPEKYYAMLGWKSWHDWIGFNFMPFPEARTYMRRLGLKNREDYLAWQKSGKRPKSIPACPEKIYEHTGWLNLKDWLGIGKTGQ